VVSIDRKPTLSSQRVIPQSRATLRSRPSRAAAARESKSVARALVAALPGKAAESRVSAADCSAAAELPDCLAVVSPEPGADFSVGVAVAVGRSVESRAWVAGCSSAVAVAAARWAAYLLVLPGVGCSSAAAVAAWPVAELRLAAAQVAEAWLVDPVSRAAVRRA
jgi:hypothetical protein